MNLRIVLGVLFCLCLTTSLVAGVTVCGDKLCIHGTCSGTTCTCESGWVGPQCGTSADDCASNPCLNGGMCIDKHQSYTCVCAEGFEGTTCNTHVGCRKAYCQQGSSCVKNGADYTCSCPTGYSGKHCESITESLTVSRKAGVTASSSYNGGEPKYAVDGILNHSHDPTANLNCSHTYNELPFWTVFFDDLYPIRHVRVHNNVFDSKGHYFRNVEMFIDGNMMATWDQPDSTMYDQEVIDFYFPEGTRGRNVNITKTTTEKLILCEVEVWGYIHD